MLGCKQFIKQKPFAGLSVSSRLQERSVCSERGWDEGEQNKKKKGDERKGRIERKLFSSS